MKNNDDNKPDLEGVDDSDLDAGEREQASALRDGLEAGADPIAGLLSAALRPGELDEDIHEQILAKALGLSAVGDAAPSREAAVAGPLGSEPVADVRETRAAGELREALESRNADHPLVGIAHALKNAHAPRAIDDIKNETLLRPALKLSSLGARRRLAAGAVVGALAVAAAFLGLYVSKPGMFGAGPTAPAAAVAPLAPPDVFVPGMVEVHSTGDLFQPEDFPRTGGATSRIDRISEARQADLRQNRFAAWGLP